MGYVKKYRRNSSFIPYFLQWLFKMLLKKKAILWTFMKEPMFIYFSKQFTAKNRHNRSIETIEKTGNK